MSEKTKHSTLPTTVEQAEWADSHANANANATARRRKIRVGLFKLGLVAAALYTFFWLPFDSEDEVNNGLDFSRTRLGRWGKGGCHGKKDKAKYTFESHMQADVEKLVAGSLESSIVWDRLAEMTDTFGNRIAGSESLEKSIDWIVEQVKGDGLSVTTEDVTVDHWARNEESLYFLSPTRGPVKLHMLGLGFSPPTPVDPQTNENLGVEAEIIVVASKDELDQYAEQGLLKGRIVVYNKPFESYGSDVIYRGMGATWAQEHGAVAVLVRSIGPVSLQSTHTGNSYATNIPAASVSVEDAQLLARSFKRHRENPEKFPEWPKVKLTMNAETALMSRVSRNIIVELKGRESPEEIVAVGGHIDSWDVGSGAVDDGAGCFIAWEVVRQLSLLNRPPRRTVRAVFWTSEENGSPGGRVYAANHPETNTTRHVLAFESDSGVFDPYGIKFTAGRRAEEDPTTNSFEFLTAAGEHFLGSRKDLSYKGAGKFVLPNGSGADIAPLCKQGVACAQYTPADPFPLPYSTSPYYIKKAKKSESEEESNLDEQDGDHHRYHHHRHDRHHRKHPHHDDDDDEDENQDPPRRPVDSGYFYYHHTEADTMSAFTPDQVKKSAAVMAIWTYIAAESRVEL
ncbi:hypothetical protein EDD21DRAFT_371954 [Dissophora ornata]|nr:hypothetical protein BGZ58_001847 [Dissophora ornata]KAI8602392.1 hypothetical protein EDD21DRAFT_371954 [Dissophora ornata]